MFNFLKQIFSSSRCYQNDTKLKNDAVNKKDTDSTRCSLEVQMNIDGTINIICYWPEYSHTNKDKMTETANNYALMIDAINQGYLSKDIINTIKNYRSENSYDSLFAQNVFYKLAELNYLKQKSLDNSEPLVRPTQVFKNTH